MMNTLLAIANLGQKAYGRWLFTKLIFGCVVVMGFIMVIAIMISATLIGGLIFTYISLVHGGTEPYVAMIMVSILSVVIVILIALAAFVYIHYMRQIPKNLLKHSPLTSHAMNTLDAFTDGLMAE